MSAKHDGVVYTPPSIVRLMLDRLLPADLRDIRICEPACGDGAFLSEAVRRICLQMRDAPDPSGHLRALRRVSGFDIDPQAVAACRERLTATCRDVLGSSAPTVEWRIRTLDVLHKPAWQPYLRQFDYVVGNPPYVRIQHLEADRRARIAQAGWELMSGCADLYFLFFEAALKWLAPGGSLAFITPSTWLKTAAGRALRSYLRAFHTVTHVVDFGDHQVFPGVATYTAITHVRRGGSTRRIPASRAIASTDGATIDQGIAIEPGFAINAAAPMWSAMSERDEAFLAERTAAGVPLRRLASIGVGIQTLADRVFILAVERETEHGVVATADGREVPLERGSVRRIYKASVMRDGADPVTRVAVYPYDERGKLVPFQRFQAAYPQAGAWLRRNRERLLARDKGRTPRHAWHAYGRHVGITSALGRKILTSGMNVRPNFMLCAEQDALFYSGYGVRPRSGVNWGKLLDELNSEHMRRFIRITSRPYRHGWYSYAKTFIQDFPVSREVLE